MKFGVQISLLANDLYCDRLYQTSKNMNLTRNSTTYRTCLLSSNTACELEFT